MAFPFKGGPEALSEGSPLRHCAATAAPVYDGLYLTVAATTTGHQVGWQTAGQACGRARKGVVCWPSATEPGSTTLRLHLP